VRALPDTTLCFSAIDAATKIARALPGLVAIIELCELNIWDNKLEVALP